MLSYLGKHVQKQWDTSTLQSVCDELRCHHSCCRKREKAEKQINNGKTPLAMGPTASWTREADSGMGSPDHHSKNSSRNLNYSCNLNTVGGSIQAHPGVKPPGRSPYSVRSLHFFEFDLCDSTHPQLRFLQKGQKKSSQGSSRGGRWPPRRRLVHPLPSKACYSCLLAGTVKKIIRL